MKSIKRYTNQQQGYLLMDVVIALTIVGTALLSIVGMFYQATNATTSAAYYTKAVHLGEEKVEELKAKTDIYWNTQFPQGSGVHYVELENGPVNGYTRKAVAEINVNPTVQPYDTKERLIKITVNVFKQQPSDGVTIVTYVLRDLPQFPQ